MLRSSTDPTRTSGTTARRVTAAQAAIENLRPAELVAELDQQSTNSTLLIDVRSAEEHRLGTIIGSINVPRGLIELVLGSGIDPSRRVVVYCETGARSALTAALLYDLGYHDVAHLDGGLVAWCGAGHPLTIDGSEG
jgi:rhodanese-related sulfurtransferase